MISHSYDFTAKDLGRVLGPPLIPVMAFAAFMHLGARSGGLPTPRPTLDLDRTLLIHKIEASRARQATRVILLGDSSCLMDAAARELSQGIGWPVLNLGLLSYLDLDGSAALLGEFIKANPGRLRAVVLLQHPEALRRPAPETYHSNLLHHLLAGRDWVPRPTGLVSGNALLGLDLFRGRILSRTVPAPLPGAYGQRYGFTRDLERYLTAQQGSAIDPETQPLRGSTEYRLAQSVQRTSARFRAAVPAEAKLLVGITPVPEGLVGANYRRQRDEMLRQWGAWLRADAVLTSLPATFPNDHFARTTHLNERGVALYTAELTRALQPHLPRE